MDSCLGMSAGRQRRKPEPRKHTSNGKLRRNSGSSSNSRLRLSIVSGRSSSVNKSWTSSSSNSSCSGKGSRSSCNVRRRRSVLGSRKGYSISSVFNINSRWFVTAVLGLLSCKALVVTCSSHHFLLPNVITLSAHTYSVKKL